jgi:outer membrane protein assembly factor BamB
MFQAQSRRPGRYSLGARVSYFLFLIVLPFLVFTGLAVVITRNQARATSDPDLLAELARSTLLEDDPPVNLGEWPQWRGPRRDGISFETGLLKEWPKSGPVRVWQAEGGDGYSSVSVAGGLAITQFQKDQKEVVICWDATTGKEKWRHEVDSSYVNDQGAGPRSTPTLDGDRVYTVGPTGLLECLRTSDGAPFWAKPRHLLEEFGGRRPQWGVSFSPLVEGNLLVTCPGGSNGNSLAAFDKMTGQLVWQALDDPPGYSSPIAITAADVRQVIVFTGDSLVSVSPEDGTLYWRVPWDTQFKVNAATPIHVRARVDERINDYLFISSGYDKGCALLKIVKGGNGRLETRQVYFNNLMRNHFSSSVRYKDHFYGFHEAELTCMEVKSGQVVWSQRGFQKGSLIRADDTLIVLGERGQLALVKASPAAFEQKAAYQVVRQKTWTPPVLAQGKLYIRDQDKVICLDMKGDMVK